MAGGRISYSSGHRMHCIIFFAAETLGRWPHCIVQWPLRMAACIGPVGDDGIERLLPSLANGSGASYWVVPIASTNVPIQMPQYAVQGLADEQDSWTLRVAAIKPSEPSSMNAQGLEDNSSDLSFEGLITVDCS